MAAVEVLAVENVELINPLGEKAGHVRLFEEVPDVSGEKQHPGIAEEKLASGAFSRLDVDQHILYALTAGNPR